MIKRVAVAVCMLAVTLVLSACVTTGAYKKSINEEYYANSSARPIMQTDIKGIVDKCVLNEQAKVLFIMLEGVRASAINYIYDSGDGIARLQREGGLYHTAPKTSGNKAKIGIGTRMLSIMTGVESADMGVMKSTDPKRVEPNSMLMEYSLLKKVEYVTDYADYVDIQLQQELATADKNYKLTVTKSQTLQETEQSIIKAVSSKDVVVATVAHAYRAAEGNYSLKKPEYLSAISNINAMIESVLDELDGEWRVIVTSTFGGVERGYSDKKAHNAMTFMATNFAL